MGFGEAGDRVRLIAMVDDPDPVPPGTEGTIDAVDGAGTRHVRWDNGREIGLIPDADQYELIESNPVHEDHRCPVCGTATTRIGGYCSRLCEKDSANPDD
jgi:hypothetical protein